MIFFFRPDRARQLTRALTVKTLLNSSPNTAIDFVIFRFMIKPFPSRRFWPTKHKNVLAEVLADRVFATIASPGRICARYVLLQ